VRCTDTTKRANTVRVQNFHTAPVLTQKGAGRWNMCQDTSRANKTFMLFICETCSSNWLTRRRVQRLGYGLDTPGFVSQHRQDILFHCTE